MVIETTRFGLVDVDPKTLIQMPRGLFGFEEATEFCLIQHRADSVFRWLQSTAKPQLAFVVVDPSEFFTDYVINLSSVEAEYLNMVEPTDATVLTIVSIEPGASNITANLAGPIVINSKSLMGMQVALEDERFGTKHVLVRPSDSTQREELPRAA